MEGRPDAGGVGFGGLLDLEINKVLTPEADACTVTGRAKRMIDEDGGVVEKWFPREQAGPTM